MVMYELMSLEKPFYDVHPTQKWEFVVKGKKPTLSSGTIKKILFSNKNNRR